MQMLVSAAIAQGRDARARGMSGMTGTMGLGLAAFVAI